MPELKSSLFERPFMNMNVPTPIPRLRPLTFLPLVAVGEGGVESAPDSQSLQVKVE